MNLRFLHRWLSIFFALPLLVIVVTGILLASRSFLGWMQPEYPLPKVSAITISFSQMLAAAQSVPEVKMQSWSDISQIDIRPKTGQIRLRSKHDHWEMQIDPGTAVVLGFGQRRVGWFTSLHQGALLGEGVRYGIFYPAAWALLFLLFSGVVIFLRPYGKKWNFFRIRFVPLVSETLKK